MPIANDNHLRFTDPAMKLWGNPTGKHVLSVGISFQKNDEYEQLANAGDCQEPRS